MYTNAQLLTRSRYIEVNGKPFLQYADSSGYGDSAFFDITTGQVVDLEDSATGEEAQIQQQLRLPRSRSTDPIGDIRNHIKRFIYLKNESEYDLVSIIPLLSFFSEYFDRIPYFWFNGPKGSGKTSLMTILKPLVYNAVFVSEITPSALFRIINDSSPTLFLDESEQLKKRQNANQPMFQILNSGYQKDGSVMRSMGSRVVNYCTYGLKIIAGINSLHSTLADRSIPIMMEVAPVGIKLERYSDNLEGTNQLVELVHSGMSGKIAELKEKIINPSLLNLDQRIRLREADKWIPVLSIASLFSTRRNNYFQHLHDLAIQKITEKAATDTQTPESMCSAILKDFLQARSERSRIPDPQFFYFPTEEIQKVIQANDPYNYYRDKAEFTRTLKRIGIDTDRRRIGQRDPVLFYKIPRSLIN